jgi:tRNA-binding protein
MIEIQWSDFERVELRVGTIVEVLDFPEAHRPVPVRSPGHRLS